MSNLRRRRRNAIIYQCSGLIDITNIAPLAIPPLCTNGTVPVLPLLMAFENGNFMEYESGILMEYESNVPSNWFNLDYKMRIPITIQSGQVPSPQTDFPLLINSIIPDISNAQSGGEDIRFASQDGLTEFKVEVPEIDTGTGELIAHTKIPLISDGTVIYLYFNNPTALLPPLADRQAVWSNGYNVVYHFNNNPLPGATVLDSAPLALNGTPTGITQVAGKIGQAYSFTGFPDHILFSGNAPTPPIPYPITISCWFSTGISPVGIYETAPLLAGGLRNFAAGMFDWQPSDPEVIPTISFGVFHHLVVEHIFDGNRKIRVYLDGVDVGNATGSTNSLLTFINPIVGNINNGGSGNFVGIIDEHRITIGVTRSADWVKAEFNNQNAPETFYNLGPTETLPTQGANPYIIKQDVGNSV